MAEGRVFQPAADDVGARDGFIQLRKLPFGYISKPFGRPAVAGGRLEQETNLVEAQAGTLGCFDDGQLAHDLCWIAAAAADPFRWPDEANLLVVTDRRGRLARAPCDLTDREQPFRRVRSKRHGWLVQRETLPRYVRTERAKRRRAKTLHNASTLPNGKLPIAKPYALERTQPSAKRATNARWRRSSA
jgi:hypothetical protein